MTANSPPLETTAGLARLHSDLTAHITERDQLYADLQAAAERSPRLSLPSAVILRLLADLETVTSNWDRLYDQQQQTEAALRLESAKHDRLVDEVARLKAEVKMWAPTGDVWT